MPAMQAFSSYSRKTDKFSKNSVLYKSNKIVPTRKGPEGLRAPGVSGVNPRGLPQESGGDSKAI